MCLMASYRLVRNLTLVNYDMEMLDDTYVRLAAVGAKTLRLESD